METKTVKMHLTYIYVNICVCKLFEFVQVSNDSTQKSAITTSWTDGWADWCSSASTRTDTGNHSCPKLNLCTTAQGTKAEISCPHNDDDDVDGNNA